MKLDVIFVLYNSAKWLDGCLKSIEESDYDLKNLSLYFADNNSIDDSVEKVEQYIEKKGKKYNDIKIIKLKKNKGFGYGNNQAMRLGHSEWLFIFNVDTEVMPDTFKKIEAEIEKADDKVGILELAQRPYEHPKYYNPITLETDWASGACMLIRRELFEKCKGFDTNLFMYCEDVELSFHVRMLGYKIKYLPNVPIQHYSYKYPREEKLSALVWTPANNLYLRCKYGKMMDVLRGVKFTRAAIMNYPLKIRMTVKKNRLKMLGAYIRARFFRTRGFRPQFVGFDYGDVLGGAFMSIKN